MDDESIVSIRRQQRQLVTWTLRQLDLRETPADTPAPAPHALLGWLNYGGFSPLITMVAQDGGYWLEPLETSPGGLPKALKIFYSTNPIWGDTTWFYVEYRQPLGFDSFLSNPDYATEPSGVFVRLGNDGYGDSSWLLDMTPETEASGLWHIHDQALAVGQSYTDPYTGMTITLLWAGGNALVNVTFPKP